MGKNRIRYLFDSDWFLYGPSFKYDTASEGENKSNAVLADVGLRVTYIVGIFSLYKM